MAFWIYFSIAIILGYLAGSVPYALIVGRVFYKTDVRDFGSHNLGTTNVARVLGLKAGILVLILDSIKSGLTALAVYLLSFPLIGHFDNSFLIYLGCGVASCFGHCYPIFSRFKGGKAVASLFGFLAFTNYKLFLIFLIVFAVMVLTTKIVSIASLSSSTVVTFCSLIPFIKENNFYFNNSLNSFFTFFALLLVTILLFVRHIPNIKRLIHKEEKKFKFKENK